MNRGSARILSWVLFLSACPGAGPGASPVPQEDGLGLSLGGVGGVYFLAEPGELTVEVGKRDRNRRGSRTELRALLAGPDRRVVQEAVIPDDGQPRGSGLGPPRRVRLSARAERKGVYALNVTVSNDRYGEDVAWSFRTNCRRYVVETSRGHKDEAHQEPIVLLSPERPGDVCFLPREGAFEVKVTGLAGGAGGLAVFDSGGAPVGALKEEGKDGASGAFPAGVRRDAVPWRLHLPRAQATVHIDGVTRWEKGDARPDLAVWSPDPASWFPFTDHRWLLTPYSRTVYGPAGRAGQVAFQVRNDSAARKTVRLALEFPAGGWPARLSADRVALAPRESAPVIVHYTVPAGGGERSCHLRAAPEDVPDFSTYSTLTVKAGEPPASRPLSLPLVLRPYQHENEQFGYLPDYPVESQPYFDLKNRPFLWNGAGVAAFRDGAWVTQNPGTSGRSTKIAFDRDNDLYLLATSGGHPAILRSADGGRTFDACAIPGREGLPRTFDIEQFSGHNVPEGPPPVLRYTQTAADPRLIWRRLNDLELLLPRKENGRLTIGEPVLISRKCIGFSAHSGIPASVVSRGARVHVVWGEATEPAEKAPGVPTYAATWDRETGKLSAPVLISHGAPANDVHNTPSITMDSQGYLHALAGTHGRPFPYARSLKPNDASGWTEAQPAGEGLPQTYVGFVCGADDTLHLVFRLWRSGVEPFPASQHATLAWQRKRPGQAWEPPQVLVVPPFSEYSVFYHRLTIDHAGRLFLSYDYWSTHWFYRNDHLGSRRALLMSPDGGDTWKLASGEDLG